MAHPYHHALSSVRRWGGTAEDYLPIHDWFDESKKIMADFRHRALRHHAEGIFMAERLFGATIQLSSGRIVPTRFIGEQHVQEDCGWIPSAVDWLAAIRAEPWMKGIGRRLRSSRSSSTGRRLGRGLVYGFAARRLQLIKPSLLFNKPFFRRQIMSIKIRIGLSRKVGEPNYGSRGASFELEAEVDSHIVSSRELFEQQVQAWYQMARASLDSQLESQLGSSGRSVAAAGQPSPGSSVLGSTVPGNSLQGNSVQGNLNQGSSFRGNTVQDSSVQGSTVHAGPPLATDNQLRAIYALAKRQQLEPLQLVEQTTGKPRLEDLTVREASQLIDQLKQRLAKIPA